MLQNFWIRVGTDAKKLPAGHTVDAERTADFGADSDEQ